MALWANLPFALAPGMGLNAFFVYTVVLSMGHSWQFALTAVFLEGIIFILLAFFNIRQAILNSIPMNIKRAISVGIGLFIAFIGLVNSGVVVKPEASKLLVALGDVLHGGALLAVIGLVLTGILLAKRIKGALLLGIIACTLIGIPMGVTKVPDVVKIVSVPPAPTMFAFEFSKIFTLDMFVVLLTFLFVDMFDTVGTLIGVSTKAGLLDEEGRLPQAKPALLADAIGTTVGACLGTSTVTTYVESASGVAEGGRTGLTALSAGAMFAIALFFAPLFTMVPAAATAPALILVGLFMMSPILDIDLLDYTEAIPAFLTIIIMPLTYSIAEGIVFGIISFVALKTLTGRAKEVHVVTYVIALLFILKFFL
jgi:AGZA family xanthine/uracil permease-like MFS transporter